MTKLDELIQSIENPHVYVQMHNYPDQDALASAMGLQALLSARGKQATIIYHGIIDKDNTLKMIELLNIKIQPVESLTLKEEDEIIIVDGQKGNINMQDVLGKEIACIDHHHIQNTEQYRFVDIRSNVGACSSIIASYFVENAIPLSTDIATALVYGLKMDTSQLSRGVSSLDITMFGHLFQRSDHMKLRTFETSSLKISDLTNYQQAISDLEVYGNIAVSNIGNDCSESIIGSVNDFLLTLSEVEFTVIYSYRAGGIKFSLRSTLPSIDASEIIRQALYGLGDGGGHNDMAAGFIPNVSAESDAETLAQKVKDRIIFLVRKGCYEPKL
jgi:nanoRNase/pAp phosphatase (c-di-AMP/oligoRNAs hydrolase)